MQYACHLIISLPLEPVAVPSTFAKPKLLIGLIIDSCCSRPLAGSLKPFSDSNYGRSACVQEHSEHPTGGGPLQEAVKVSQTV